MAINQPYEGKKQLTLLFEDSNPEHVAFKKLIEDINPNLIGTKNKSIVKEGQFTVRAKTTFDPKVTKADGSEVEGDAIPSFFGGTDQGTARMVVKPGFGGKQPGLYLQGVQLVSIIQGERESAASNVDMEALKQNLSDLHQSA